MNISRVWMAASVAVLSVCAVRAALYGDTPDARHAWAVHDRNRPNPPKVTAEPGQPPSDAIILFDGKSLDNWENAKGEPAKWVLKNGAMYPVKNSGAIRTKQSFGDCQLHIEWASPTEIKGVGQGRGNSGVFLMGNYEVQVLDSYETYLREDGSNANPNYADGQAGAIYAENPPLVNACRKPGEWQSFDIIFHQPIWEGDQLKYPGSITVLHNGVLVQDHWEMEGLTTHGTRRPLAPHAKKLPLQLQDHGNPTRFRNIWIREIPSRYDNTTHGGPAADETDVMALRKKTAARLFNASNLGDTNKRAVLGRILEILGYSQEGAYLQAFYKLEGDYLQELAKLSPAQVRERKDEIISLRNECNVLKRNQVFPEDGKLLDELQRIIQEHKLEKKK